MVTPFSRKNDYNRIKGSPLQPVICFEMLYPGLSPVEKIEHIAKVGFNKVEFWGWRDKDIPAIAEVCRQNEVGVANLSGHRRGSLVAAETHELFLSDLKEAVQVANTLNCSILMVLSNALDEDGRVVNSYSHIPAEKKYLNLKGGLKKALAVVPEEITLVLEPLNTRVDHPGYFLADMETAVSLVREINNPRFKVLCDLYHLGVMGQDLQRLLTYYIDDIGYIHIADFPGRHEPGTGSADWATLLTIIKNCGYQGFVGFEYSPLADSYESLRKIRSCWDRTI